MPPDQHDSVEAGAHAGDSVAMREFGRRLVRESPARLYDALTWLARAAGAGDAVACETLSVMAGSGAGTPQSWPIALAYLGRAAELGLPSARRQIEVLEQAPGVVATPTGSDWRERATQVPIPAWLAAPATAPLACAARLNLSRDLLPPAACTWLVERARPLVQPAQTFDPVSGAARPDPDRNNDVAEFDLLSSDLVLLLARWRMATLAGMSQDALEYTSVLRYRPGQEFRPHYDFLDPRLPGFAEEIRRFGQRIATCLVYLNDDYSGGETDFPELGIRHRGTRGDALLFYSVDPNGAPDRRTLHAGLPPSHGEKWLLSQFIRRRPTAAPPRA